MLKVTAWFMASCVAILIWAVASLPDISDIRPYEPPLTTRILASDGTVIATLHKENRSWQPLSSVSKDLVPALLATEDYRFFQHHGMDSRAVVRAASRGAVSGEFREGASTITMQLARNLVDMPQNPWRRKLQEVLIGWQLEYRYGKWELLEIYLNRVYFGAGAYGVHAAAGVYFDKSASELTLSESALLIGLIQSPSHLCPIVNKKAALQRCREVLTRMLEVKGITRDQYEIAVSEARALSFEGAVERSMGLDRYPYFSHYAIRELVDRFGEDRLYRGGMTVVTSLDRQAQKTAQRVLQEEVNSQAESLGVETGAVVVLENRSGLIKAMVGGMGWSQADQFNRAFQAERQPGSSFKPVIYAAALQSGYGPESYILDSPLSLSESINADWPRNSDGSYLGRITLRQALRSSRNAAAVRLFQTLGSTRVTELAHEMGIEAEIPQLLSVALGAFEVTPLEMAAVYSVPANDGQYLKPTCIKQVKDSAGLVLEDNRTRVGRSVLGRDTARIMNGLLQEVVQHGTGVRAQISRLSLAGKTGTTDDYRDAWFCGYSPRYTCVVWTGRDDNGSMNRAFGGELPADIFRVVMGNLHPESDSDTGFLPPTGHALQTKVNALPLERALSAKGSKPVERTTPESVPGENPAPVPTPVGYSFSE